MEIREIEDIIIAIIPKVTNSQIELNRESLLSDLPDYSSLLFLALLTEVEEKFEIKFKIMDLISMKTVADVASKTKSKLP